MAALPAWMPVLLERINWGLANSPWFVDLADEEKVLARGRRIVLDLWPFINELPINIAAVRAALPEHMAAATQLLNKLGDSELHYQKLFRQQFKLAGINSSVIAAEKRSEGTLGLCKAMSLMCRQRDYADGIHAIVAAELAATMYCRSSLPLYEQYFAKYAANYEPELIEAGLEWLRLHAKNHVRHAILMKRMLNDLGESDDKIPQGAEAVLNAVFALWECPADSNRLTSTTSAIS